MVAGVIFMNVHKLNINAIRGFGRKKPLLAAICLLGALGIGGVPGFSGYVSKTLLHESIVEYMHELTAGNAGISVFTVGDMKLIEWIFLISGGLTIAYMCKLFVAVFVEKNKDEKVQEKYDVKTCYMRIPTTVALSISASLFLVMGVLPHQTMDKLSAEDQQIIYDCAKEAEVWHRDAWEASEAKNAEIAIEKGCTLTTLTAEEQKAFQDAVAPMYDSFLDADQKAIVERIQALG